MASLADEIMAEFEAMTDEEFNLFWKEVKAEQPTSPESLVPVERYKEISDEYDLMEVNMDYYSFGQDIKNMDNNDLELAA